MCAANLRLSKIQCGSELARDGGGAATEMLSAYVAAAVAPFLTLISAPHLTTLAERRHCAVGIPAWMPG
jgi:hypothetical protein